MSDQTAGGRGPEPQVAGWPAPDAGYPQAGPPAVRAEPAVAPLWPAPTGVAPVWFGPVVLVIGLLAALTVASARPGLDWALVALAVAAAAFGFVRDRVSRGLLVLAVALVSVAAISDSLWLVGLCLLAGVSLAAVAVLDARSWPATLLSIPALGVAWVLALPWLARSVPKLPSGQGARSWARGVALAAALAAVFCTLLGSADPEFAQLIGTLSPRPSVRALPLQVIVFVLVVSLVVPLAFGASSAPNWQRLSVRARKRPVVEWLLPLAAVDAVLLVFGILQAELLFGGYSAKMYASDVTYADRVHQGFGQLVAVTLLTLALLGWAGRRADRASFRHRRALIGAGGLLVALALAVVASALRRLWLYEQAYGWTVLRLNVGVLEVWLGVMLLLVSLAWATGRSAGVARMVVAGAGGGLLVLALAGPDALVARWNVERQATIGKVDVAYLSQLSADAYPELACLPEPYRSQVLGRQVIRHQPLFAANLARARGRAALADVHAGRSC